MVSTNFDLYNCQSYNFFQYDFSKAPPAQEVSILKNGLF